MNRYVMTAVVADLSDKTCGRVCSRPEGEDINADLGLAGLGSKLLEEDVFRHPQAVLAVCVVQGGVIPLCDLAHSHIGHRGLEEQQLAPESFHHEIGCLQRRPHGTVWLQHHTHDVSWTVHCRSSLLEVL